MRTWLGIILGFLFGVALIFLPHVVDLIGLSNYTISREAGELATTKSKNADNLKFGLSVMQSIVFMIGTGSIVALGAYLLAKRLKHGP
jgi:predicted Co/Zn/Cd cation transporter (cation efflux family)